MRVSGAWVGMRVDPLPTGIPHLHGIQARMHSLTNALQSPSVGPVSLSGRPFPKYAIPPSPFLVPPAL